jgi:hypothetical protein
MYTDPDVSFIVFRQDQNAAQVAAVDSNVAGNDLANKVQVEDLISCEALDNAFKATTQNQYGRAYKHVRNLKPGYRTTNWMYVCCLSMVNADVNINGWVEKSSIEYLLVDVTGATEFLSGGVSRQPQEGKRAPVDLTYKIVKSKHLASNLLALAKARTTNNCDHSDLLADESMQQLLVAVAAKISSSNASESGN